MKRLWAPIILGCILVVGQPAVRAAPPSSDWPALNADAAQSNYNPNEATINGKNVLKLKAKWSAPIADQSYPIVAAGRVYLPIPAKRDIHVRVLDAATGKTLATYKKDALGGILAANGSVYLAGRVLQAIDPSTGQQIFQVVGTPKLAHSTFLDPQADQKYVFAGFDSGVNSSIYTLDASSNQIVKRLPSTSAFDTIAGGRVLTSSGKGGIFYDESSGRAVARPPYLGSHWFAGAALAYTVAPINRKSTMLLAFAASGRRVWGRVVGPLLATQSGDWPHALGPNVLYLQTFHPGEGIEALNAQTGTVRWTRHILNVEQLVLANHLLFALTYGLGEPVRVVVMRAGTGKVLGAIVLGTDFFAFNAYNAMMVADGMLFIRGSGPNGPELVALGL